MGANGFKKLAVFDVGSSAFFHPQHHALTGTVNVRIQQANFGAFSIQCQGQIYCCSGLAYTTLTGSHGDDVFDMLKAATRRCLEAQFQFKVLGSQKLDQFCL